MKRNYSGHPAHTFAFRTLRVLSRLYKAKNAHMWRGSPIRISMYGNQSLLRASTTIH